jgi:hypothetical protein
MVGIGNDDALDGLDPFAAVIDACAGVDGAEDGVGIGLGLIGMLDEELGGKAQVPAAAFVESLGACVAIDGVVIRELVLISDQVGISPIDELFFYVGTVGVMADGTFARVAIEGGGAEDWLRCGLAAWLARRSRASATNSAASPPGMILEECTGGGWSLGWGLDLRLRLAGCLATIRWRGRVGGAA